VSEGRPLLRWQSPPGVETVTLTLQSDDGIERPPVPVSGSQTTYPAEWEPLQAGGASYRLQISGGITSTGFSLLETETINHLHRQTEAIRDQIDTEPGRTLVLAELFLSYGLRSEAADLLSALPDGEGETAVQQQLGKTYLYMGLFNEAQTALSQSLLFAQRDNLPEAAAHSLYLLGWTTCGLGLADEAQHHWETAFERYRSLGIEVASLAQIQDRCDLP
jgi:tetratricopeptide (TPR) repeat protein